MSLTMVMAMATPQRKSLTDITAVWVMAVAWRIMILRMTMRADGWISEEVMKFSSVPGKTIDSRAEGCACGRGFAEVCYLDA